MASPVPISPLSAAHTLVSWITEHGREPYWYETGARHGLLGSITYTRKLPGSTFSAIISAARAMVSSAPKPRMQLCLGPGCDVKFVYTGYHFCSACRTALGYDDADGVNGNGRFLRAHDRDEAERGGDMGALTGRVLKESALGRAYVADMTGQTLPPLSDREHSPDDETVPILWRQWSGVSEDSLEDEQVYGFDDHVARQMNAWQRVSRKRRFFQGA